ncbi:MAG: hypothetical protein RL438_1394, partial [Actinomycetota bacterium]
CSTNPYVARVLFAVGLAEIRKQDGDDERSFKSFAQGDEEAGGHS